MPHHLARTAVALAVASSTPAAFSHEVAPRPVDVAESRVVEVVYYPPVAPGTPITDRFRPPATPYGAGNRGIDYATADGQPVAAAAAGTVVFAGQVGGRLHAVVLHAGGIRTSYSYLQRLEVHAGDHVEAGSPIGAAAADPGLHVGARRPDGTYLDPLALFGHGGGQPGHAWLVPDDG